MVATKIKSGIQGLHRWTNFHRTDRQQSKCEQETQESFTLPVSLESELERERERERERTKEREREEWRGRGGGRERTVVLSV